MEFRNLGIASLAITALLPKISFGTEKRPNVLIIMTDQQRWDALQCAGNLEIKTPNMDRISKGGVQFTNAYSACPVSVPARTTILTGHTIFNNKVLGNNDIEHDDVPQFQTFDQILSANGYRTEYYGKWHVPYQFASKYNNAVKTTGKSKFTKVKTNVDGFREYLDEIGIPQREANANELIDNMSLRPYTPLAVDGRYGIPKEAVELNANGKPKKIKTAKDSQANNLGIIQSKGDASLAAYEGHEGLASLKAMKPEIPFSLTISFGPPHPPFIVPKEYADLYQVDKMIVPVSITDELINAPYQRSDEPRDARFQKPEMVKQMKWVYYAMISQVDQWVGKILDELDKKGVAQNTIVLFVSDHGEMLGDHGLVSKMKMYEGSVHIPLMIRFPGVIPAGVKVNTPVSQHDIFATILDYAGMAIPENDGRSLRTLIDGKPDPIDYTISTWGQINNGGPFMVRQGDWKLIVYLQMSDKKQKNVCALYNLKADPNELNNLIGNNPAKSKSIEKANGLKSSLKEWMIKTKTPYLNELENTNL